MAGDWIKMRNDLDEDPAVIELADKLGVDEFAIVGRLHKLWSWADKQSRDGHARGVTPKWVDRHVRCEGFAEIMVDLGWLAFPERGLAFPNFDRHNGETAKVRAQGTKRQKKHREDITDESRNERDNTVTESVTREEKRREELLKASARTADAHASDVIVTDGDGKPITSVIANLTAEQSATVVKACVALRKMGALRYHPGDDGLAALAIEGFTAEQIVRCAGEKALRDGGLWNDPDAHPELFDLLVNGASQQDMGLTQAQYLAVRSAAAQVPTNYLTATLRGRRRDAAEKPAQRRAVASQHKPSATDNFEGKTYDGTPIDRIHPSLRPSGEELV